MWLTRKMVGEVDDAVDEVFRLSYAATRTWNDKREAGAPLVFSGWYWAKGATEAGPFKSQSAAYVDAWWRLVARRAPPTLHRGAKAFKRKLRRDALIRLVA
jgi:hypothetical protein